MDTHLTRSPHDAAEFIKLGGIVAFPTETVYGLGADVFNADAIKKVFEAKHRPADNPLIAHIGALEQVRDLAQSIPEGAAKFIDAFYPGPLTVVLKKADRVPLIVTAGLDTIGVRMPANETAREFLRECATPVAAPSANLSGKPSPTTWEAVFEDLNGRIDCILQGEPTQIGLESTVVDCTSSTPLVLRLGFVSIEELRAVVPGTSIHAFEEGESPRSPGVRHKHYTPRALVVLAEGDSAMRDAGSSAYIGLTRTDAVFAYIRICETVEEYAREVFEFFRECDRQGIARIYCEAVNERGIGAALMDRIRRAAA